MVFSDLALALRLERAEGDACLKFARARRRLFPDSGADWMECGGGVCVFDGVDSPITQSFGLGLAEPLTAETLDIVERFFFERGAAAQLEISPLVGVPALDLLCTRGYKPIEVSSVLYRDVAPSATIYPDKIDAGAENYPDKINVRLTGVDEAQLWSDVSARAWAHEIPHLLDFLKDMGAIMAVRENCPAFLASLDGTPGAAGVLCLHEGIALFGGAATVPELRRRGLQAALFDARMRYAHGHGCDIAMVVTAPASDSQRNAERKGFRIAYTRTKWSRSAA